MFPTGIQGLGQLLGDGGTAALRGIAGQQGFEEHAAQGFQVYSGMLVEAFVLRGHGGLHQRGGQFFVAHEGTVLYMISGKDFAFFGNDLGGQLGIGVLQLLDGRDIGQGPDQDEEGGQQHYRRDKQDPEPLDDFFLDGFCHVRKFEACTRP